MGKVESEMRALKSAKCLVLTEPLRAGLTLFIDEGGEMVVSPFHPDHNS